MDTPIRIKTFAQQSALISVGLLLLSNPLFAADTAFDAQGQVRDFLSGTVDGRPKTFDAPSVDSSAANGASVIGAQEQAQRFLFGKTSTGGAAVGASPTIAEDTPSAPSRSSPQVYADLQDSVRGVILGVRPSDRAAPDMNSSVSLTQDPLVMRLNKDEFRIAFGINAELCGSNGCIGVISYRVDWKAEDGTARSEHRHVNYAAVPGAGRTMAVDHQYFDTAEGAHTTEIVKVSVEEITSLDTRAPLPASAATKDQTVRPGSTS